MREMIKEKARTAFKAQYWPIVGIELLAGILTGGIGGISMRFNSADLNRLRDAIGNDEAFRRIAAVLMGLVATVGLISLLYTFLFGNVIRVGIAKIRLTAYRQGAFRTEELFFGLKQYGRIVGAMALYTLFVTLGFLFCFVPGIIVALGLYEVPYLLAEEESLSGMEAIRRSWENMKGHKGELFLLGLSFIGWILLTILTCGILAAFYTGPYMALAKAGFYRERHPEFTAQP